MWNIGNNRHERMTNAFESLTSLVRDIYELHLQHFTYLTKQISSLTGKVESLMADRAAFDASISTLSSEVTNLLATTKQVIAKLAQSGTQVDFSNEKGQLEAISKNVESALSDMNSALNSPAVQAPTPIDAPAAGVPGSASASTSAQGSIDPTNHEQNA